MRVTTEDFLRAATSCDVLREVNAAASAYTALLPNKNASNDFWIRHIRLVILPCLTGRGGPYEGTRPEIFPIPTSNALREFYLEVEREKRLQP